MSSLDNYFATPMYSDDSYLLSIDNINLLKKEFKDNTINAGGNYTSKNTTVLNNPNLKNFKDYIESQLDHYWHNVLEYTDDTKLVITQSWINFNTKDTFHHIHQHSNSIISGVFYIENPTPIIFDRPSKTLFYPFVFKIKNNNSYNNNQYHVETKVNDLLIFPSSLLHMVDKNTNTNTRISLSFNTFVDGILGEDEKLTGLNINVK